MKHTPDRASKQDIQAYLFDVTLHDYESNALDPM